MEGRLRRVMNYATTLLHADQSKFTKLMFDMTEYQAQLQHGLSNCITYIEKNSKVEHFERAGMAFDLCYGNEVVILIKFLTNFTRLAEELMQRMYKEKETEIELIEPPTKEIPTKESPTSEKKQPPTTEEIPSKKPPTPEGAPTDLEEGDVQEISGSGSGSGSGDQEEKPIPKKFEEKSKPPMPPKPEKPSRPPIPEKPQDPSMPPKPEEPSVTPKDPGESPEPLTKQKPVPTKPSKTTPINKEEQKPTTDSKLDIADNFFNNLMPGPVIIDPVDKDDKEEPVPGPLSKEDTKIAEEAYERIEKMHKAAEEGEDEDSRSGKSRSPIAEKDPDLSIDLDLPGVDAGVNVQIGPNGVQIDSQSGGEEEIVFEEVTTTATHHNGHHHGHSFKVTFLIYFFATLGVLLTIALLILIVILVRLKMATPSHSTSKKDPPLLSEQEKIAVMKKSGYVNPTYKFFDEVKDV